MAIKRFVVLLAIIASTYVLSSKGEVEGAAMKPCEEYIQSLPGQEGKPLVKTKFDHAESGCLVVTYKLHPREDSDGLFVYQPRISFASFDVPSELRKTVLKSIGEWYFSARTHAETQKREYFSIINLGSKEVGALD